jgi:hypothetical protein
MNIIRLTEIDREIRTAFPPRTPWFTFTLRCVGRVRIADRSFLRYAFFYFTCLPLLMIPVFLVFLRLLMMPRQYIYSMDKTVYIFSGQDSIYIQWTRQYIYSMDVHYVLIPLRSSEGMFVHLDVIKNCHSDREYKLCRLLPILSTR